MNIAVRPASMLEEPTTEPPVINIPAGSIAQNKPVYASSTEPGWVTHRRRLLTEI